MDYNFAEGEILLIDKPLTWTSFDVVKKIRNILRIKKIGHAGTLDPLASGLLILCTGKFTKRIDEIQAQEKEYTGTITIGQTTPSYDLETPVSEACDTSHLTEANLKEAAATFVGTIEQVPPIYSAVWVDGKRAYDLARGGKTAEMKPRTITIKAFDLTAIEGNVVSFKVVCTKGTYIRSLAHDFGQKLGCGAHLSSLVRTRIGQYKLEDALTIEHVQEIRKAQLEAEANGSNS
ncbi:tRNA pseudouridine(55) synthase TruB [Pontibacter sp. SGAir0037]|uniref:tRNA pseudouridine(55) synthase TruB n=1 Tax=Pontibacter sp. SGAir0037 TaxID=2571030 RepID=UPI0010CD62FF|nr:tRNA pseudouridine(55) synthase TruB [Pontibacter sp. SGAir0037]QCR21357.1 tRNA pseudouridine(55) synthase TruB [Pontibacter sp. SGAir0037]